MTQLLDNCKQKKSSLWETKLSGQQFTMADNQSKLS